MSENIETLVKYPEIVRRLQTAFPNSLSNAVNATLAILPNHHIDPTQIDIGLITISGEILHIPSRFYSPEPDETSLNALSEVERSILSCLYTRHHDGFVRMKYLNKLFNLSDLWVSPFVLQLIGEYVIEIIEVISKNMGLIPINMYKQFVIENPPLYHES